MNVILFLALGIGLLLVIWLAGRGLATARPETFKRLSRNLVIALLAGLGLYLFMTGKLVGAAAALLGLASLAWNWYGRLKMGQAFYNRYKASKGPTPGGASRVRTGFLDMALDHETGALAGQVIKGRFAGRDLGDLADQELLTLFDECRAADPRSVAVLEAYLDRRLGPGWRGGNESAGQEPPGYGASSGPMSRAQAFDILGLEEGDDEAAIRDAHRRLQKNLHPDRGGSSHLAALINQAKDVLLGR
ncbi:MAG: molecular chaperone DnaJ [Alphaproteobacteria bacterium]